MATFWFLHRIFKQTATRNDFTSHGSYVFLITMLAIFVAGHWIQEDVFVYVIGWLMGMVSPFIREYWDEETAKTNPSHTRWDALDILSGLCGATAALLVASGIMSQ